MRKFFLLIECSPPIWRFVNDYDLNNFDDWPLLTGEKLESKPDNVKLHVTGSGKWPALLNNPLSWFIVSNKLKEILENFAFNHCHFFSLDDCIVGEAVEEGNYWLLSFFRKIDCMNREISSFREMAGQIAGINHLVIDPSRIPMDDHIFFMDKCGTRLIVDQVFVDSLIEYNIVGVTLSPINTS